MLRKISVVSITPEWLFARSGIEPSGAVAWRDPIQERGSGVYVITAASLPGSCQQIVYIGRAKCLCRRLSQFYRHKYGAPSPHRGGQEILKLDGPLTVHWGRTESYAEGEHLMMEAFRSQVGAWPYGNRVKSARMTANSN
jgi:hypothetical protein